MSSLAKKLVIGSRKSDLARIQALTVGAKLQAKFPNLDIKYHFKSSLGDRNLDIPLRSLDNKGVFTLDFFNDLVAGRVDMVVHSWKDLPVEARAETEVVATLAREDVRDVLLVKKSAWTSVCDSGGIDIFSSSPRRIYNLEGFLKKVLPTEISTIRFIDIRGNVPTRFKKLFTDKPQGMIVAKAALDRLLMAEEEEFYETRMALRAWLDQCFWMALPIKENPPAAAQGALAIEIATGHDELKAMLLEINSATDFADVTEERKILAGYGGGCHQKIGVGILSRPYGKIQSLQGLTDAGEVLASWGLASSANSSVAGQVVVAPDELWPNDVSKTTNFFNRTKAISASDVAEKLDQHCEKQSSLELGGLWVSKAEALPQECKGIQNNLVWVSGTKTWQKLADRGIWVNGSSEGLGEQEVPRVEVLTGKTLKWLKLSHTRAPRGICQDFLATYELSPEAADIELTGYSYFFWSSGSAFLRAVELAPEIGNKDHACGPGHSYDQIRKFVGPEGKLEIFLSIDEWRAHKLNPSMD